MSEKETRFVNGPWEVRIASDFLQVCPVGRGDPICDFGLAPADDWSPEDRDEVLGNANITAAAPDLYEAAKLARDGYSNLIEMWEIKGDDPVLYVYAKLVSALSKALGETP